MLGAREKNLKTMSITISIVALVTGLLAAWDWFRASRVQPKPNWRVEPVVPKLADMGWTTATLEAFEKAGRLNARAALWTALSVALGASSSLVGNIS